MSPESWPAHSVPLRSRRSVTVNLANLDARVVAIVAPNFTTNSLEKESGMPEKKSRKQPTCKTCKKKLVKVPHANNGWGHKKREHWVDNPHKAVPVFEDEAAA